MAARVGGIVWVAIDEVALEFGQQVQRQGDVLGVVAGVEGMPTRTRRPSPGLPARSLAARRPE
jgi:hypothetical protein